MRRSRLVMAVGLTLFPLVTACAAGQNAVTRQEHSVHDGADADLGDLRVRNAHAAYPAGGTYAAGGSVPIYLTVVNIGTTPDSLIGVASPSGPVVLVGSGTPSPAPSSAGPPVVPLTAIPLPAGERTTVSLLVAGISSDLRAGAVFDLTMQFDTAGSVTVGVAVSLESVPGYGYTPSPAPSG